LEEHTWELGCDSGEECWRGVLDLEHGLEGARELLKDHGWDYQVALEDSCIQSSVNKRFRIKKNKNISCILGLAVNKALWEGWKHREIKQGEDAHYRNTS
jgi:hypothetical protein